MQIINKQSWHDEENFHHGREHSIVGTICERGG